MSSIFLQNMIPNSILKVFYLFINLLLFIIIIIIINLLLFIIIIIIIIIIRARQALLINGIECILLVNCTDK